MRNALKYLTVAAMSACGPWSCAPAIPARTAPVAHPPRIVQSNNLVLEADAKDEPTFVQHPGQSQRTKLAEGVAAVLGRYATPKATYLLLRVKHEGTLAPTRLETLSDAAGRVVVGAVGGTGAQTQSVSTPEFDLILRITGPLASAGPTRINWVARRVTEEPGSLAGGYEQSLSLSGLAEAPTQRDLEARFGEAMAAWFDDFRQRDPFMTFAASRLVQRFVKGIPEPNSWRWRWHNPQVDLLDLMDFYTGRSTIRDSLQIERGMQLPRKAAPHTVDPSSIKIAPPRDRNYEQLVAKDSARSGPVLSPLSTVVPADALVIEFASLKDVIQLPRLLDQKLGQILRVSEGSGGPNHLIERYRNQLAIELDGFAETVGQFAVRSVTVVLGDAYLREGTDLSLVFRAENQALLESVLANHLARAKLRRPDLQSKQERIGGEPVFVHATADGAIRRYEYVNGDIRVLSNSRAAMARLILVKQGKLPKLSDDKGYLGARSLAPFDLRRERAFVFFGDAFVANVVGPRSKILEARRMRAQAELQAVD